MYTSANGTGLADGDWVSPPHTKGDSQDVLLRFVGTVRKELPVLLNVTAKNYIDKGKKNETCERLSVIFRGSMKDAVNEQMTGRS